MKLSVWKWTSVIWLLCSTAIALAQNFSVLADFNGTNGANPLTMTLVQGLDGNFYGTTSLGGANSNGTVFKITQTGVLTTLYSFCAQPLCADGFYPQGGLLLATDGNLYGTTSSGGANGYGTVFKITSQGELTTLHSFSPAEAGVPSALVQGENGDFYGTSMTGGSSGKGTVFKITFAGTFTTLYTFCTQTNCPDGYFPRSALVEGSDGSFYGTAISGGADIYYGTIFKITRAGMLTTLHSFDGTDGDYPIGALVQGLDGSFYGTTADGGTNCPPTGCGTAFRITAAESLTTLFDFDSTHGANPFSGLIQGTDRNFYGTTTLGGNLTCSAPNTSSCGTIFEISPGGTLTTLHNFGFTDGYFPEGGLLQSTTGTFYGTTYAGGNNNDCGQNGCGTVFSVSTGLGPFVTFVRRFGRTGSTIGILGQGFEGSTSVVFNGTPASFTVRSQTFLTATVPTGATSGFVTVTTPTGTLTSNVRFRVIP